MEEMEAILAKRLELRYSKIRTGKQTVSTIDKNLQMHVEDLLERRHWEFLRSDIRNLAAIVIDVKSNEIMAYYGNVGFNNNEVNFDNQAAFSQ